ncbi:serine--pyruvate aminotransferase [Carbonactinospora thermoautotrophica]|uniref:Serine--pyruvate aminotransferase n=1 Tax=Carbonactinospora thermoautotrophica TaxID=1469144 RepID=A0A132MI95_9ACTN|nr:TIGR00366 family protein [Carbonactinospora thermoautotrophica]KWW97566.1 serine--pyruvate aminotransferase [Carbonactinospora thermoautotrophica]KWX07629.1 serine--pyruvate aminotransferase [Carbonactinospora thermoautotrophica]MCX9191488.1 serine--pyruvate aminotransferase [Carbonactinospora thermoautotrophica]
MVTTRTDEAAASQPGLPARDNPLARIALRFTAFTERWLPDAFGFVLVGTFVIFALGLLTGEKIVGAPADPKATTGYGLVDAWGKGFWSLIQFTLQMAMIIIGGYAVAVSRPVARLIARLAQIPKSPRAAIAFTAAVAMLTAYLNWAFSLVFTAILAKEIARLVRGVDYRALGAMAFLGLGTVWAQGLSGSAALQVASESSSPAPVQEVIKAGRGDSGLIPLTETIFLWQGIVATAIIFLIAVAMAWLLAPSPGRAKTAQDLGIELRPLLEERSADTTDVAAARGGGRRPGDWLEYSPLFAILIFLLGLWYLARYFANAKGNPLNALDLNTVNLILLLLALILHWRPLRLVDAVRRGAPAASGVLLQFPFYGGIFGMIAYTGLAKTIAGWLVDISNAFFYPAVIAIYSCVLGIFVPSGGSKWVIEAPYVIEAANQLQVHQGWMVVVYDLGEASANLLQPFWMLPTLAILGLKARDIMGYTFAMFLACFPAVLVLVTLFAQTLGFPR